MKYLFAVIILLLGSVTLALAQQPIAVDIDNDNVAVACSTNPSSPETLFRCAVRVSELRDLVEVNAIDSDAGVILPASVEDGIPATDDSSIIFLIDRSNPARAPAVRNIVEDFREIASQKGQNQAIAVMSFANELTVHSDFSTDLDTINAALDGVEASGLATELFRLTGEAVKLLAVRESQNKVLMLASDGKAEDRVYMAPEVIEPSVEAGIRIVGLGYVRRESDTPDVQLLRKLAEDSGGTFHLAPAGGRLTDDDLDGLLRAVSTTTNFRVQAVPNISPDRVNITLSFNASSPVTFSVEPPVVQAEGTGDISSPGLDQNGGSGGGVLERVYSDFVNWVTRSTWGLIVVIAGLALLLLGLVLLVSKRRKAEPEAPAVEEAEEAEPEVTPEEERALEKAAAEAEEAKRQEQAAAAQQDASAAVLARLSFTNSDIGEVKMTSNELRIGRHSTDDVYCADQSVSRQHVLISRNPKGRFEILNRQSDRATPNPIYVNNQEVVRSELNNGDAVRIGNGDTSFTFFVA